MDYDCRYGWKVKCKKGDKGDMGDKGDKGDMGEKGNMGEPSEPIFICDDPQELDDKIVELQPKLCLEGDCFKIWGNGQLAAKK